MLQRALKSAELVLPCHSITSSSTTIALFPMISRAYKATNDGLCPGWLIATAVLVLFCVQGMALFPSQSLHYSCDSFFRWNEQYFPANVVCNATRASSNWDWTWRLRLLEISKEKSASISKLKHETSASSLILLGSFSCQWFSLHVLHSPT